MSGCACCETHYLQPFIGLILALYVVYSIISYFSNKFASKNRVITSIISILYWAGNILVIALAVVVGVLSSNPDLNKKLFSHFMISMAKTNPLDEIRCELLKDVHGDVLELGPGPGSNFRCMNNNSNIHSWSGVEPNEYFQSALLEEKELQGINFPTSFVWLKGETIDAPDESYDSIVATHVLCSVDDISKVIHQIKRVLKPGGTYYFLEHIQSPQGTLNYFIQRFTTPFHQILFNGCKYVDLLPLFSRQSTLSIMRDFDMDFEEFEAPIGIPFLRPHIKGFAVKKR